MLTLEEIHQLEIKNSYPAAIEALEQRLEANPNEEETIVRLGFNYWLLAEEGKRVNPNLPTIEYAERFMNLFRRYEATFKESADFCFAFGLGMSLFWYLYPGATEQLGKDLLKRAAKLDAFYKRTITPITWFAKLRWRYSIHPSQEEFARKFGGRGVLAKYYNVA